jgi:hypothetical protein
MAGCESENKGWMTEFFGTTKLLSLFHNFYNFLDILINTRLQPGVWAARRPRTALAVSVRARQAVETAPCQLHDVTHPAEAGC